MHDSIMTRTWILVADRAGARVFQLAGVGKGFQPVENFEHPEGRLKNHDFNTSGPGRSFDSKGGGRHSMAEEVETSDAVAMRFATRLADFLNEKRKSERIDRLVLAAEPGFLGMIRNSLSAETSKLVTASVTKNLSGVPDRELPSHFSDVLPV